MRGRSPGGRNAEGHSPSRRGCSPSRERSRGHVKGSSRPLRSCPSYEQPYVARAMHVRGTAGAAAAAAGLAGRTLQQAAQQWL
jgi:hypothetical protein